MLPNDKVQVEDYYGSVLGSIAAFALYECVISVRCEVLRPWASCRFCVFVRFSSKPRHCPRRCHLLSVSLPA